MMVDLDPRLGHIEGDSIVYPLHTLGGNPYRVAQTTRGLGDGYFVVLDPSPAYDVDKEIVALLTVLQISKRPLQKAKRMEDAVRPADEMEDDE